MTERPSPGEQLAGIAGLALILTMFLFAWYGFDVPGRRRQRARRLRRLQRLVRHHPGLRRPSRGMALALFGNGVARSPIPLSVGHHRARRALGRSSCHLHHQPARASPSFGGVVEVDLSREFGVWLGLIELIALTFGGYKAMQEEGVSFGGAADRLSGRAAGRAGPPAAASRRRLHRQPPQQQQPPPPPPPPQPPAPATAASAAAAAAASHRRPPPPAARLRPPGPRPRSRRRPAWRRR